MFNTQPLFYKATAAVLLAAVAAPLRAQESAPLTVPNARAVFDGYVAEAL